MKRICKKEWVLGISLITCLVFALHGAAFFALLPRAAWLVVIFIWLFAVIFACGISAVRHAEHLAERLGEPFGTLILTLSITSIEAMSISAAMLHGGNVPTLVAQSLFSVIMIVMNLMVGLSLLAGAWRHTEQVYNLQGANTYLGLIIPLAVFSLILPDFTTTTAGPTLSTAQSIFLAIVSAGLYATFLAVQATRHRGYFILPNRAVGAHNHPTPTPVLRHVVLLLAYLLLVIYLAEQFAHPVDYVIETLHQPVAFGGLAMALIVATPEALGAVRAAQANDLQRSINIFLGSVLSTIGLTIPIMLVISEVTGHSLQLGLQHSDSVLLLLTLAVSMVTFASGRTNVMQGAVHLILFASYFGLIFRA